MAITKIDTDMIANDAITANKIVAGALDTQLAGYLSTNSFATESYVGTALSNLVDASPATLDTLNELAAALGDDPNFATTTATAIGLKAPLASPSFTGAATFGGKLSVKTVNTSHANNMLEVAGNLPYASSVSNLLTSVTNAAARIQGASDASNSLYLGALTTGAYPYMQGSNYAGNATVNMVLQPFGGNVGIGTTDPSALLHLKSTANAAGPNLIFENTNNAQSMNIDYWNNGGAVQSRIQYAEGPASWNFIPNVSTGASALHIAYNGNVGIGTTSDTSRLKVYNSTVAGNTQLHIHNDKHGDAAALRLEGKRTSANDTAQLLFANNGSIVARIDSVSAGDDGNLRFFTSASGTGNNIVEAASIDADGSMTARSFIPNSGYNIEYLIVGGGGGGGTTIYDDAGGGGAGGYRSSIAGNPSANYAPPEPPLLAVVGKTYAVTVGAGGNQLGGGNSSGFGLIQSEGGGRAGNHRGTGAAGGSGGGGSGYYSAGDNVEGGIGFYGQGNNGGQALNYSAAGGGGGAGAPGAGGSGSSFAGGAGVYSLVESAIDGQTGYLVSSRVYRAGGGGAYGGGAGGLGGGGRGWSTSQTPTAGAVNTGGGGGGNKENHANSATVGGGSGIVILKVPTSNYTGITTGSPTVTTIGNYKILKFTSSGSYTA